MVLPAVKGQLQKPDHTLPKASLMRLLLPSHTWLLTVGGIS